MLPTKKMAFQVYRLRTTCAPNNEYFVNRHEEWTVVKDEVFDTITEARAYVIQQSKTHTDLPIHGNTVAPKDKPAFYQAFCFGDGDAGGDERYMAFRRFFIGYPPIAAMKAALGRDGIKVLS